MYSVAFFQYIKKNNGLLDPLIGRQLKEKVLAKGGSVEPICLIHDFLGTNYINTIEIFQNYINQTN
jgi:Zn-dependent oligopeptidase